MRKPLMNLANAVFDDIGDNGYYTLRRAAFASHIGAHHLGYNLTVLPPGKAQCPFHNHRGEEEMFFILEGEGELRFGDWRCSAARPRRDRLPDRRPRGRAP